MKKIKAKNVLFIKLGSKGSLEKECIEDKNLIKLGYTDISHDLCIENKWKKVHSEIIKKRDCLPHIATMHSNQIQKFYNEGSETLWITFYKNKLWWCFAKTEIIYNDNKSKQRKVMGKWSDTDINGKILFQQDLSGRLLKTQGFRGTICSVAEHEYVLRKINAEQSPEVIEVEKAFTNLVTTIQSLIKLLTWKDFEILIDLIFRSSGWSRLGVLGKTTKTIDLEIMAPVTGERGVIQIKSQSNLNEYLSYEQEFLSMLEYNKFFYIAHTQSDDLIQYLIQNEIDEKIFIYDDKKIAELTINSGLTEWLITTVS